MNRYETVVYFKNKDRQRTARMSTTHADTFGEAVTTAVTNAKRSRPDDEVSEVSVKLLEG